MRIAPSVTLSPEERATLERWAGAAPRGTRLRVRARAILAAADGRTNLDIGAELRIHRLTVARWRREFSTARLRGLRDPPARLPHPGGLAPQTLRAIVRAAALPSPSARPPPSSRTIARALGVSHMTVLRVWNSYRIRPTQFAPIPIRPDPPVRRVAVDVVALHVEPGGLGLVVRLAPATHGETFSPSVPAWGRSAHSSTIPSIPTWVGIARWPDSRSLPPSEELVTCSRLLRLLDRTTRLAAPQTELAALLWAPGATQDGRWGMWSSRHPQCRLSWAADLSAWKSQAARWLEEVGAFRGHSYPTAPSGEVARSLSRTLDRYAEVNQPFEWVAHAREIRRGAAAHRLRYDLSVTGRSEFKTPQSLAPPMSASSPPDPRAPQMARNVLRRSLRVRPAERVTIESWSSTLEYANAMVLETLRLGARPLLIYQDEATYWAAAAEVRPEYLARLGEHRRAASERTDVLVSFFGPSDRERFHSLPRKIAFKLGEYQDALYRAAAKSGARAVQMALGRASVASARMYGVDLVRWKDELVDAALVDPRQLHRLGLRIDRRLRHGRELTITHPNGTDLRLLLRDRPPDLSDGLVPPAQKGGSWQFATLPSGVLSILVSDREGDGVFRSNVPSSVGLSDAVGEFKGGEWRVAGGRLDGTRYEAGQELFGQSYARAGSGRERLSYLSIGLNPKTSLAPLLEDQGLGTVTLHLGRSDHVGGSNRVGWWAWSYLRGATVKVDGKPLLTGGRLRVGTA